MGIYHYLFTVDNNYLFYMFVTIQSVLDHLEDRDSNSQDLLTFHILCDDQLDDQKAEAYTQAFTKFNSESKVKFTFEFHKVNGMVFEQCEQMVGNQGSSSWSAYYRLLFAQVIPPEVKRLLYLDIDLYINVDTRLLFEKYPMQNEVLYAASEPFYLSSALDPLETEPFRCLLPRNSKDQACVLKVRDGLQSGVMLINVDQWRAQNIEQQCIKAALTWETPFYDQDVLSIVCQNKISYLDWDCNMPAGFFWLNEFGMWKFNESVLSLEQLPVNCRPTKEHLEYMCENPKILHFAGEFKPWKLNRALSKIEQHMYRSILVYMQHWLVNYGRLSKCFQSALAWFPL